MFLTVVPVSNIYFTAFNYALAKTGNSVFAIAYANALFDFWYLDDPTFKFNILNSK